MQTFTKQEYADAYRQEYGYDGGVEVNRFSYDSRVGVHHVYLTLQDRGSAKNQSRSVHAVFILNTSTGRLRAMRN